MSQTTEAGERKFTREFKSDKNFRKFKYCEHD